MIIKLKRYNFLMKLPLLLDYAEDTARLGTLQSVHEATLALQLDGSNARRCLLQMRPAST
jgi:hypothetical protein